MPDYSTLSIQPDERNPRIARLLLNLIKNAREAMPGGGRLTIATEPLGDGVVIRVGKERAARVVVR